MTSPIPSIQSSSEPEREVLQILSFGDLDHSRRSPASTSFANTGRHIYVIGDIDGRFRPRSNPYDLHARGGPHPDDPLANALQGVWAQPVKALNGYMYVVELDAPHALERWELLDAHTFTQTYAAARFDYRTTFASGVSLNAARQDFAALDRPVLFTTLTLTNSGSQPASGRLAFTAFFDFKDAWFTSFRPQRNRGQQASVEGSFLVARSMVAPSDWAAAVGGLEPPGTARLLPGQGGPGDASLGELSSAFTLEPGQSRTWTFAVSVAAHGGAPAALSALQQALPLAAELLAEKQDAFTRLHVDGPRLRTPDSLLDLAFEAAKANLLMLEAEGPQMLAGLNHSEDSRSRYFYAGLETFPFWFSNDGYYSTPGMLIAGFDRPARGHALVGLAHQSSGCIPHQVSPAGHTIFPGNAQETPQWVSSLWEIYRYTGDRDFLARVYPGAVQGVFEYCLGAIDQDGDGYPEGPGMVEVEGMGAEKLDTVAYLWEALRAVANMAIVLDDRETARLARQKATWIEERFEQDWWDEAHGTYCMSLEDSGSGFNHDPHWAVVTPLETGLAVPDHALRTLDTLQHGFLNQWGLKHTAGEDERVWTLPTVALSRAAFRYGDSELGLRMLQNTALTLEHGPAGLFHELIPEGLCFVQLWSGATLLRGVVEDLLGIEVDAANHRLRLQPKLPAAWSFAALDNLAFGRHRVSVQVTPTGVEVRQSPGSHPLTVSYQDQSIPVPPGEAVTLP